MQNSLFFRGWVFLVLAGILLLWGILAHSVEIGAFALSGLLYEGAHFFVLSAGDFRYHWWTALCGLIGLALVLSTKNMFEPGT